MLALKLSQWIISLLSGYVGNEQANANTIDANGWLKTGDLCYFDEDGFLHLVDRLKELIKYKAYQVSAISRSTRNKVFPQFTMQVTMDNRRFRLLS